MWQQKKPMGYQSGLVWTDSSAVGLSPSWTIYTSAGAADRYLMFLQANLSDSAMSVTGGLLDKQLKKKKKIAKTKAEKKKINN